MRRATIFAGLFMAGALAGCSGVNDSSTTTTPGTTHLYVSSVGSHAIDSFSGISGAGSMAYTASAGVAPAQLFVDTSGRIYFADTNNNQIIRVNDLLGTGMVALSSGGGQSLSSPAGVYVDSTGHIFIADKGNNRIVEVNDMTGVGWTSLGGVSSSVALSDRTASSGVGQFSSPSSVYGDSSGHLYIADSGNDRIVRMNDITGAGWTTFGTIGSGVDQFQGPLGVYVDTSGHILVCDTNNRISEFNDMTGTGWTTFGASGSGVGQFDTPLGIFEDASGHIYVADSANNRVVSINNINGSGWTTLTVPGASGVFIR